MTWLLLISGTASLTVYADRKFGPSKRAAIRIQKLTARMEWEQDQVELQKWWTAYCELTHVEAVGFGDVDILMKSILTGPQTRVDTCLSLLQSSLAGVSVRLAAE